jgi:CBS domain-containing protein
MKVREVMTRRVIRAEVDTPVADIARLLTENHISAVPITDKSGAVVGLVSEYDLLAKKGLVAGEIMTADVITVSEEANVDAVQHLLIERRVKRVPVMSGQELVGIVSRSDIVRLMAEEWICETCGEAVRGDHRPDQCPKCAGPQSRFVKLEQSPGA